MNVSVLQNNRLERLTYEKAPLHGRFETKVDQALLGISRIDIIVALAVLLALGGIAYVFILKAKSSAKVLCASNLKELGVAMTLYEHDNNDRLPYASIRLGKRDDYSSSKFVWDSLVFPLIPLGKNGLEQKHLLRCPADTEPPVQEQARRRTYAMPSHTERTEQWPISDQNETGVGIWWNWTLGKRRTAALTNYFSVTAPPTNDPTAATKVIMPPVTLRMIHAPATTLLLTENAWSENTAFNFHGATIDSPQVHLSTNLDANVYHEGKINYLMVDGHVELMYPSESVGQPDLRNSHPRDHYPNVWTIRSDD